MNLCDELESKIVKSKEESERLIGAILQEEKGMGSNLLLTNFTFYFSQLFSLNFLSDPIFEQASWYVHPTTQWLSTTNRDATLFNVASQSLSTGYIPNRGIFSVE